MNQPGHFGPFLLFQETGSNRYRSCYRAGITRGRAVERIVRLEVFDRPGFEATELLAQMESSKRIQASLADPHIATGAGLGHVEGTPYAAFDFELGTTLAAFSQAARERSFPIPLDQALFVAERIALALAAAYRVEHDGQPTLHSFLTPEAVLLSNVGEVKVSGFETAPWLRRRLHAEPFWAPYLSPQCRAGQARNPQDDVFSLGSLLFELVTGEPLSPESPQLDTMIVRATGEPAPQSLQDLLQRSLAEPASRIPDVLDWQRSLGKLILDGEYNPTTFNLAFLLHTLLREPLERGLENLEREKRFVLPQASPPPATTEETARTEAPAIGPEATVRQAPPLSPSGSASGPKPFWLGFSISAIAASALLGSVLVWGGQSKVATLEPVEPESVSSPRQAAPTPPPGAARAKPDLVPVAEPLAPDVRPAQVAEPPTPDVRPSLVLSEVVQGQLGRPLDDDEIRRTLAERTAEIERNLAAEYEKKLEALRSEVIALRSLEDQAVETPPETTEAAEVPEATGLSDLPTQKSVEADSVKWNEPDETLPVTRGEANGAASTGGSDTGPSLEAKQAPTERPIPRPIQRPIQKPAQSPVPDPPKDPSQSTAQTLPQLLRLKPPLYPSAAKRLGLSATAQVHVVISPEGDVLEAKILGPELGSGFDRAALAAVRRSKWKPAMRAGEPIESTSLVTLQFQP